jgi:hypothetical protein
VRRDSPSPAHNTGAARPPAWASRGAAASAPATNGRVASLDPGGPQPRRLGRVIPCVGARAQSSGSAAPSRRAALARQEARPGGAQQAAARRARDPAMGRTAAAVRAGAQPQPQPGPRWRRGHGPRRRRAFRRSRGRKARRGAARALGPRRHHRGPVARPRPGARDGRALSGAQLHGSGTALGPGSVAGAGPGWAMAAQVRRPPARARPPGRAPVQPLRLAGEAPTVVGPVSGERGLSRGHPGWRARQRSPDGSGAPTTASSRALRPRFLCSCLALGGHATRRQPGLVAPTHSPAAVRAGVPRAVHSRGVPVPHAYTNIVHAHCM